MMDLGRFDNADFDRGRGALTELLWLLCRRPWFDHSVLPWYRLRRGILRGFGAQVGSGVIIKPKVTITFPWKLELGDNVWLGEGAYLLNLDHIRIGANVCISQRAFLCSGSHDWSDPAFRLITRPITVEPGAWICADVFVGPGVTIGAGAVATAGSVVISDLPPGMICSGNPCQPVKPRPMRRPDECMAP